MPRRIALFVLVLVLLAGVSASVGADDVPEDVRELYEKALRYEGEGDLKKAYSALSKARRDDPVSVDFWELYVRVWRGLDKKEDVLWRKIIGKVEKKNPSSPVFELLRARLAEDTPTRLTHLRAAAAKDPDAVRPQLLLAKAVLADGDDIGAEEILEEVLEKHPGNEEVLVTLGELDLDADRALSAMSFAEEKLEEHDLPGLHDLRARALLAASETDASRLEEAEASARKALEGRDDPRYARTLVDILDRRGDLEGAMKALDEAFAKHRAPVLAAKLGELAFRRGEYEKAIEGLAVGSQPSTDVLKALAICHKRLGNVEAMRRVCARLKPRLRDEEPLWIAWHEVTAWEPAAGLAAAEGVEAEGKDTLVLWAKALQGDVAGAKAVADERARGGGRWDEESLIMLLKARLVEKLGPNAAKAIAALRDAEVAAAKAGTPAATVDEDERPLEVNSLGFMARSISYRRTLGGRWFSPVMGNFTFGAWEAPDGKNYVRLGMHGQAECPVEAQRVFWFNPQEIQGDQVDPQAVQSMLELMLSPAGNQTWAEAEGAFEAGAAAMVGEDWAKAKASFAKALELEPGWGRARLFAAVAGYLGGGDAVSAAKEAAAAIALLPDDFEGQRLLAFLQALAGQDIAATARAVAVAEEARTTRRMEHL